MSIVYILVLLILNKLTKKIHKNTQNSTTRQPSQYLVNYINSIYQIQSRALRMPKIRSMIPRSSPYLTHTHTPKENNYIHVIIKVNINFYGNVWR